MHSGRALRLHRILDPRTGYAEDREEGANLQDIGRLASECRALGLPLVVEPLAVAPGQHRVNPPEVVELLARIAWEAGADLLKVDYTGSRETFARVVRAAAVPVLVRGGPRTETAAEALAMVAEALEAGARGVVFGRNVWQHDDPAGMVRALRRIVHEGAGVGAALRELSPAVRS